MTKMFQQTRPLSIRDWCWLSICDIFGIIWCFPGLWSFSPPMTQFFLDCPGYMPADKNPGLAKSYMKLMVEIWHKNR